MDSILNALRDLYNLIFNTLPFKITLLGGLTSPAIDGVSAPVGSFYAQYDTNGNIIATFQKVGQTNLDWLLVSIGGSGIPDTPNTLLGINTLGEVTNYNYASVKGLIQLDNVDNTSDSQKVSSGNPIYNFIVNNFIPSLDKDVPNGVATTDTNNRIVQNIAASKVIGVLDISNIPQQALERLIIVPNETARYSLTQAQAQNGDTVKQQDNGLMYYIKDDTNLNNSNGYEDYTASRASAVPWIGVENKPQYVVDIGNFSGANNSIVYFNGVNLTSITPTNYKTVLNLGNVDNTSDSQKVSSGNPIHTFITTNYVPITQKNIANGIATTDANNRIVQNIDATKVQGVLNIANIPQQALERLIVVPNEAARFALTQAQAQNGDTVKQQDTGLMYYVVNDSQLNNSNGYEEYTAGTASSVPWTGITGVPQNISQIANLSGFTDGDIIQYNGTTLEKISLDQINSNFAGSAGAIKTALDNKQAKTKVVVATGNFSLNGTTHNNSIIFVTGAATITVPVGLPTDFICDICRDTDSEVTIVTSGVATLKGTNNTFAPFTIEDVGGWVSIVCKSLNTHYIINGKFVS